MPTDYPLYNVLTYDIQTGEFTPQANIAAPCQRVSIHGVRRALKELKALGYSCDYRSKDGQGDPSVLVERILDSQGHRNDGSTTHEPDEGL